MKINCIITKVLYSIVFINSFVIVAMQDTEDNLNIQKIIMQFNSLLESVMSGNLTADQSFVYFCDRQNNSIKYRQNFHKISKLINDLTDILNSQHMSMESTPLLRAFSEAVDNNNREQTITACRNLLTVQGKIELQLLRFSRFLKDSFDEQPKLNYLQQGCAKNDIVIKTIESLGQEDKARELLRNAFKNNDYNQVNEACSQVSQFPFITLNTELEEINEQLKNLLM